MCQPNRMYQSILVLSTEEIFAVLFDALVVVILLYSPFKSCRLTISHDPLFVRIVGQAVMWTEHVPFYGFQWSKVQSAKFSILEHQMDPSSNFSSYRSTLKAAMWRSAGATDERQRIVVPFFSLLVKDLYFLNEGCSNK